MQHLHLRQSLAVAVLVAQLLTAGCLGNRSQQAIPDLTRLPQEPQAYLDPATAHQPLISPEQQQIEATSFLQQHFAAWHSDGPLETTGSPFWAVAWITDHVVYGENLRPVPVERLQQLIDQTDHASYPSLNRRAITVRRTALRALPSSSPLFNNPNEAGEGFPFDNSQHSALAANTPLLVTHLSANGSWALVETALVYGWMPLTDLAWVDDAFAEAFASGRYVTLIRDDTALFDLDGHYRFSAGIGTLLPLVSVEPDGQRTLLAIADKNRQARLAETLITLDEGEIFPLPLTPSRLTGLAGLMLGQPYGWGDLFGGRDCSSTMRDLFAPFGLWLPRNSANQARVGRVVSLADLPPRQREQRLLAEGVPFATLVRLPGHIMLYLGAHEGRAVLLHTLWGLRTRSFWGEEGRWIVGETVVTTLEPAHEWGPLPFGVTNLRSRMESMNILTQSDQSFRSNNRQPAATD